MNRFSGFSDASSFSLFAYFEYLAVNLSVSRFLPFSVLFLSFFLRLPPHLTLINPNSHRPPTHFHPDPGEPPFRIEKSLSY